MRNRYLIIRHGESVFNRELRYQGWSKNVSLTDEGITHVETRKKIVKKFNPDIIVASPYLRTRQSAVILARDLKKTILYSKLIIDFRRSESNEGKLQKDFEDTKEYKEWLEKAEKDWDFRLPDGESYNGFNGRIKEFIAILEANYDNKNILVVTHGDVVRTIVRELSGVELCREDVLNTFVCELSPSGKTDYKYIYQIIY